MNKKWFSILFVFLFIGVVSAGVALFLFPYDPLSPPSADETGSSLEGIQEVINANNQFAFDLYFDLSKTNTENLFFSPYSISTALAMTYEGADGATAKEMKDVFHFPENDVLRPNNAAIYNKLNNKSSKFQIRTGNALWVSKDMQLLDDYSQTVEKYYGGKAVNLDFTNETEKSRSTINDFIAKQTNDKIKEILVKGSLNTDTRLVLTNAIYFKGKWSYEFDKEETIDLDFKITPENIIKTKTMVMIPKYHNYNYLNNETLRIIQLNYLESSFSMLILLPKENLSELEKVLSIDKLNEWKSQMESKNLTKITLPKFEFNDEIYLSKNLSNLGMPLAFSKVADFSKMSNDDLFISQVIHKSFISVDESGTEAAAITSSNMTGASFDESDNKPEFIADHPFIFIIQDKQTGNILFLGRMVDPSS
jgi:serpin B